MFLVSAPPGAIVNPVVSRSLSEVNFVFTAAAVAGSLVGAWVATKVRAKTLQAAFAVLLLAVAGYTAFQVITG